MRKCKVCKSKFEPRFNNLQAVCSPKCALKKVELDKNKKQKQALKDFREENKTLPQLKEEAQRVFNKYIRTRDEGKPCICCDRTHPDNSGQWDCGHFRTVGAAGHLRYNTLNAWRQTKYCNNHLGGNYVEYRKRLISKLGEDRVLALEYDNGVRKFDKDYLRRLKKVFAKRTRLYKRKFRN